MYNDCKGILRKLKEDFLSNDPYFFKSKDKKIIRSLDRLIFTDVFPNPSIRFIGDWHRIHTIYDGKNIIYFNGILKDIGFELYALRDEKSIVSRKLTVTLDEHVIENLICPPDLAEIFRILMRHKRDVALYLHVLTLSQYRWYYAIREIVDPFLSDLITIYGEYRDEKGNAVITFGNIQNIRALWDKPYGFKNINAFPFRTARRKAYRETMKLLKRCMKYDSEI